MLDKEKLECECQGDHDDLVTWVGVEAYDDGDIFQGVRKALLCHSKTIWDQRGHNSSQTLNIEEPVANRAPSIAEDTEDESYDRDNQQDHSHLALVGIKEAIVVRAEAVFPIELLKVVLRQLGNIFLTIILDLEVEPFSVAKDIELNPHDWVQHLDDPGPGLQGPHDILVLLSALPLRE